MRTYPREPIQKEGQLSAVYGLPFYEQVDVQRLIDEAYQSGARSVTIPRGAYRIQPRGDTHILLYGMTDFTVSAYDVIFVYQDLRVCGLKIENCERVTVLGLTSEYESTGHFQCRITGFDPENRYFDLHVSEGYQYELDNPAITPDHFATAFYDRDTRLLISDIRSIGYCPRECVEDLGGRNLRLHTPVTTDQRARLRVGDFLILSSRPLMRGTTYLINNSHITLKDYTVWSGLFAVAERGTKKRTHYDNFRVVPGPKPYGATEDRIRSTAGDAAHMRSCYEGALMENCLCENMGDDGVNFYGLFSRVAEQVDPATLVIAEKLPLGFSPGEALRFYARDVSKIGEATVLSAREVTAYNPPVALARDMGSAGFVPHAYYMVTLDRELTISPGDWVSNTAHVGNGFILRNNTYRNLPSRGALIKANDGLIENCTFEHCGATGIQVRPEIDWVESGYSHNLTIRNNTFIDCGARTRNNAVVMVSGHKAHDQRDIVIEGNRFVGSYIAEVGLSACRSMTVRGNTFGIDSRADDLPCVLLRNGSGFRFEGNTFPPGRVGVAAGSAPAGVSGCVPAFCSVASDALMTHTQGHDGWHFQYVPIGTDDYRDFETFVYSDKLQDGWWSGFEENYDHGCIRLWWDNTYMLPGESSDVCKTFVCPKDGNILIGAMSLIVGAPSEDGVNITIRKNGETVLPWKTLYEHVNDPFEPFTLSVKRGDRIHFRVNKNGNANGDGLDWNPIILYQNE